MNYPQLVRDWLNNDATLSAILTGGVYVFDTIPTEGINRTTMPSAYGVNGLLLPVGVVKGREVLPFGNIRDTQAVYQTVRQPIEVYLYCDRAGSSATLASACDHIWAISHSYAGLFRLLYRSQVLSRDNTMNNALMIRMEFDLVGKRESNNA